MAEHSQPGDKNEQEAAQNNPPQTLTGMQIFADTRLPAVDNDLMHAPGLIAGFRHDLRNSRHIERGTTRFMERAIGALRSTLSASPPLQGNETQLSASIDDLTRRLNEHISASEEVYRLADALLTLLPQEVADRRFRYESLEEIISSVVVPRRAEAAEKKIELCWRGTYVLQVVDSRVLSQILQNLVSNAIAHSGATRVFVGVRRCGIGCVIEVRDNGCGFSEEALKYVFQRGWRNSSATRGTGMGLWLAGITSASTLARLSLQSAAGRGCLFRVYLTVTHCLARPADPLAFDTTLFRPDAPGETEADSPLAISTSPFS